MNTQAGQDEEFDAAEAPPQGDSRRDVLGEERRASRRVGLRFVVVLALAIGGLFAYQHFAILGYPFPWKAIDPANPRFNPAAFCFTDYPTAPKFQAAVRGLFPLHTPKASVDRVLYTAGHGTVKLYDQGAGWKTYAYTYSNSATRGFVSDVFAWAAGSAEADKVWDVFVRYDGANTLIGVSATVMTDRSGALPYTQMTPTATTAPYNSPR